MKGIDPFSHFTFTLTSVLRPTERLLLILERFFTFIWLPDILLNALCIVGMMSVMEMSRMGCTVAPNEAPGDGD